MEGLTQQIQDLFGFVPEAQARLLRSALIIAFLVLLHLVFLRLIRNLDVRARYRWRKTSTYIGVVLGIFLVGRIWFEGFQTVATFLGLLSAGLVIALRDLVVNIAGWFFIIWRRPFVVGDRIQIGDQQGDVIDKRIFQFTLLEIGNWVDADQSTGRIVHVPNGRVFTEAVANYTSGMAYIWNEIPVNITFESNWKAAREILLEIARRHGEHLTEEAERRLEEATRRYMIFYSTLTPTVYTSVAATGVRLTLRYLCEPRRRRGSAQAIWEDILEEFGQRDDIAFAYPTTRYYDNVLEGKPEARAPLPAGGEGTAPAR
jgi:small-conductance mechanosensitive channel